MNVHALLGVMRADFRERIRRPSFLVTTAIILWACFMAVPDAGKDYALLSFDNIRGEYNSTWIGLMFAVVCASIVPLPAIYLARGSLRRDFELHTAPLLAASAIDRWSWMGGKLLSNFALLSVMLASISVGAMIMLAWRGTGDFNLVQLLLPIWLVTLPIFGLVAGFVILLETIPGLRGGLGNILVFFFWIGAMTTNLSLSTAEDAARNAYADPMGIGPVLFDMRAHVYATVPEYKGGLVIGMGDLETPDTLLEWPAYEWSTGYVLSRVMWLLSAGLFLLFAAIGFRRHETKRSGFFQRTASARNVAEKITRENVPLPPVMVRGVNPLRLVSAELKLMLRGQAWWWWLVLGGLLLATMIASPEGIQVPLMLLWIWPVLVWSPLGCRESTARVTPLLASTAAYGWRQLLAAWLAGVVVGLVLVLPAAVKLLVLDQSAALALLSAPLFVPALAIALGRASGSSRLFEAVYIVWWYIATQDAGALDFMNLAAVDAQDYSLVDTGRFVAAALGLLFIAVGISRRR